MTTESNTPKAEYESKIEAIRAEFKTLTNNEDWATWWDKFLALEATGRKNGWVKAEYYNED